MNTLLLLTVLLLNPHLDAGFLVGRVTDASATVSIRPTENIDAIIAWGDAPGVYTRSLGPFVGLQALRFYSVVLSGLEADHLYCFQIATRPTTGGSWTTSETGRFRTARPAGSCFRFAVMADEHLWPAIQGGKQRNIDLYGMALSNMAISGADFLVSLGDFAHCEDYKNGDITSVAEGIERYMAQRRAMEEACRRLPFYLCIGNHEGEQGWKVIQELAYAARRASIPNPSPGAFYTGGTRQSYFSWVWGDARFIVLDPFTETEQQPHLHGPGPATLDGWTWTLGKDQYDWLWGVLQGSNAAWTIVCMHHLVSTTDEFAGIDGMYYGRGGREIARYWPRSFASYEWGGEDVDGSYAFDTKRPGWDHGPIHQMLAAKGRVIVLHGHDHFFGFQELEGVRYVLCPQPSDATYALNNDLKLKGGYLEGIFLPNSGHVTLDVSTMTVILKYWRAFLPGEGPNNSVAFEEVMQ